MKALLYLTVIFLGIYLSYGCTSRGSPNMYYDPYPYYYHQGIDGEMRYRPPGQPYYYWDQPKRSTPPYEYKGHLTTKGDRI